MKTLLPFLMILALILSANAVTIHRSFRKGYPVGVKTSQLPNSAVLTTPKTTTTSLKNIVITNRVVITKEQAEKLLKNKKRYKKVEPKTRTSSVK